MWHPIVGKDFTAEEFDRYVKGLKFGAWRPQFVVLHNTGVPTFAQWHEHSGEERMKGLENYYKNTMGWSAGPHLFVADDYIWAFTPLTVPGVHSPSWNSISWGVEMAGDFTAEAFNPKVRDNAVAALATLHEVMGLDSSTLRLHKEDPKTTHKSCPGSHVVKKDIIEAVHNLILQRQQGEHLPTRP